MNYQQRKNQLMNRYPAISDLSQKALSRIPFIAKEYLEQGTDDEVAVNSNIADLQKIKFRPHFLRGDLNPQLETSLFGKKYSVPFGIAPVGLTSLMWPNTERYLAKMAFENNIPYTLSTVAAESFEKVSSLVGENGWFQLYTPRKREHTFELLDQAKREGFTVLVITVDIPYPSRRQRSKRAGFTSPPKITPSLVWQGIKNPIWTFETLKRGIPSLKIVENHSQFSSAKNVNEFLSNRIGGNLDWEYIEVLKNYWKGTVVLKGILHQDDAQKAVALGIDGIWVSNHGGRQFDGAVSSISALPAIQQTVKGQVKILFDSGVRSGLDIMRAISLGADFVFLGRPFCYGVSALGAIGAFHVYEILKEELSGNMKQVGVETIEQIQQLEPIV